MNEVENFIYQFENHQRAVLLFLHDLLSNQLELEDKLRYRIPFYYGRSWICYLRPNDDQSIELVFLRGNELSNSQGILDCKGRKQVSGITIKNITEIPMAALEETLQEALLLDETTAYKSKRKKGFKG